MNKLLLPLALLVAAATATAQCTIQAPGTSLAQNGVLVDGWTASVPIGFAFSFAGTTYTDMYLSDHGLIALHNGGVPAAPPSNAFVYTPTVGNLALGGGPILAPYYSDHSMFYNTVAGGNTGELFVDNANGGSHCTITWRDVETYIDGAPFTFQVTLYNGGSITYKFDGRVCNDGSTFGALNAIVGMSPNGAAVPAASNLNTSPVSASDFVFEEFTTTAPLTCNPLFDLQNTMLQFIPTNPGWVVIATPLICAAKNTYGAGCTGLALDSNTPIVGTNWTLTTTGLSALSPIAITFFGTGTVVAGIPLLALGINSPGCSAHISGVLGNASAPNVGGTAMLPVPVPLSATLKGTVLSAQSLGLTLSVPSFIATSNGLEGTVGY